MAEPLPQKAYYLWITCRNMCLSLLFLWPLYPPPQVVLVSTACVQFLMLIEASCTYFYIAHRLLHHPWWYRRFHKQHHELTQPLWQGTFYCSIVEQVLVNTGSVAVPLWYLSVSPQVFVLFVFFATLNAFTAHHIGWDSSHRIHHEQHTVNFGAGTYLWDRLFHSYVAPPEAA